MIKKLNQDYIEDLIIRMSYHSCAIEGNRMTLSDTEIVLKFGQTVPGYNIREMFEICNHRDAMELMMDKLNNNEPLSNILLKEIHYELSKNTLHDAGRFKTQDNIIKNTEFDTLSPHLVESTLYQWCDNLNYRLSEAKNNEEKIKQILEAHVEFEQYHPFTDGNGRTGRLIMNYSLLKEDIYPFIIEKSNEIEYKQFLNKMAPNSDQQDKALDDYLKYALERIDSEKLRHQSLKYVEDKQMSLDEYILT